MKLCIDVSPLLVRSAGVKTFIYHWLRAFKRENSSLDLYTFPVSVECEHLQHDKSLFDGLSSILGTVRLHLANIRYSSIRLTPMPEADIMHHSMLLNRLTSNRLHTSVLYDVSYVLFPHLHQSANVALHRGFDDRVLRHCQRIMCISRSTLEDAIRFLHLRPERLEVIYPGVDERYFQVTDFDAQNVTNFLQLKRPYVLFLSTIEPRKNLDRLLDAYMALPYDVREEYQLIIAGNVGWKSDKTMARLTELNRAVHYLGYVPESLVPGLVRGASVFAYPSLYEGFGFPLAQAMAAGRPCITSAISSMPEIAGDAALYADPLSATELRTALLRLLTSPLLRMTLARSAPAQVRQFNWSHNARQSIRFFEDVSALT